MGDGECNEGMVWESLLFAGHQKLYNLFVIIDYNKLQGFGSTTEILNLSSLKKKITSFNWNVLQIRICGRKSTSLSTRHLKSSMNAFSFFIIGREYHGK
mgnify:CR=1 FL=1